MCGAAAGRTDGGGGALRLESEAHDIRRRGGGYRWRRSDGRRDLRECHLPVASEASISSALCAQRLLKRAPLCGHEISISQIGQLVQFHKLGASSGRFGLGLRTGNSLADESNCRTKFGKEISQNKT